MAFFTDAWGERFSRPTGRLQPELHRTSDRTATGIWALTDHLVDRKWEFLLQGACFYHDEYRLDPDDRWRISRPDTAARSNTSPR
jgi:hypothetical protein